VTELTWQCLLHLVPQLVIAFEAAYETMSVVTSATNYVSCFFYRYSHTLCVSVSHQRKELCENDIAGTTALVQLPTAINKKSKI
jgi:hypothetical protein